MASDGVVEGVLSLLEVRSIVSQSARASAAWHHYEPRARDL